MIVLPTLVCPLGAWDGMERWSFDRIITLDVANSIQGLPKALAVCRWRTSIDELKHVFLARCGRASGFHIRTFRGRKLYADGKLVWRSWSIFYRWDGASGFDTGTSRG